MIQFNDYSEIKDLYDGGKFDIFYESGSVKYQVSHLGSTIYCRNIEKCMGMGAIQNFPVDKFYAVEKPVVVEEKKEETAEVAETVQ